MDLLKRLVVEEDGQGLVEYTLIVVLVALVFWVAIKETSIGDQLASGWSKVAACVGSPSDLHYQFVKRLFWHNNEVAQSRSMCSL